MQSTPCNRVLVAEDNADAARVIGALLGQAPDLACVATVATAGEVLPAIAAHGPDALLLDLQLGAESAIPVLQECRRSHPGLRVVVMSGHDSPAVAAEARASGAHDYLVKPDDLPVLVPRLRAALRDQPS